MVPVLTSDWLVTSHVPATLGVDLLSDSGSSDVSFGVDCFYSNEKQRRHDGYEEGEGDGGRRHDGALRAWHSGKGGERKLI